MLGDDMDGGKREMYPGVQCNTKKKRHSTRTSLPMSSAREHGKNTGGMGRGLCEEDGEVLAKNVGISAKSVCMTGVSVLICGYERGYTPEHH